MVKLSINFNSNCVETKTNFEVVMPQLYNAKVMKSHQPMKFKCLYLLHGLSDDETAWTRLTHAEWLSYTYGIAIVMPNVDRSFYTNMKHGVRYYDFVTQELPKFVESMLPISSDPRDRYIAGNSMGGYGAMKISLREEGKYAGIASFSPVTDLVSKIQNGTDWDSLAWIFGEDKKVPDEENLFYLIDHKNPCPKMYCGMGTADSLYDDYVRFSAKMKQNHFDFKEEIIPDAGHNWGVWEDMLEHALAFFFPDSEVEYTILE